MHRVKLIELAPHFQCLRVNDPRNSDGAVELAARRASGVLAEVSVAVIDPDDKLLAASMCSGSRDRQVLISYVIAEPAWKGRGLGTAAVAESIRLIHERSAVDVFTEVTDGNVVSERLLTAVGFARLDSV